MGGSDEAGVIVLIIIIMIIFIIITGKWDWVADSCAAVLAVFYSWGWIRLIILYYRITTWAMC